MNTLKVKLTGTSPLLMHSARFADPLDPATKAHKVLTSKRKRTDADLEAIAKSEWIGGLYFNDKVGPYIPTTNIKACLTDGAKVNKLGSTVKKAVIALDDVARLEYDGPRTIEEMWADSKFVYVCAVIVGRARIMRYRPCFHGWSLKCEFLFDEQTIDAAQLVEAFDNAGRLVGLGDYRPVNSGTFGRFTVEQI